MVRLSATPQTSFNWTWGTVSGLPAYDSPPGPLGLGRSMGTGLDVPRELFKRKVWLCMELPFGGDAWGNLLFRLAGRVVEETPWSLTNGGTLNPIRICSTPPSFGGTADSDAENLTIDLPAGGFGGNIAHWLTVVECDNVTWEISPVGGRNNAASSLWRWLLAVESCNVW